MEQLHNGFTLRLCEDAFPLSTDSISLAGFVRLPKNARVLDLGSGCGTLGLLLCAQSADCHVTGVEISPSNHQTALDNAAANYLTDRLTSICADLKTIPSFLPSGGFSVCISNPPYFSGGFQSQKIPHARHTDTCELKDLFQSAGWALKYGGDFFIIHKPEQLGELCRQAAPYQLIPKRLQLLRHRSDGPVSLILMQFRKGAKPGLKIEEVSLHHSDGQVTDYYKQLYHL